MDKESLSDLLGLLVLLLVVGAIIAHINGTDIITYFLQ